ncbi:unnamed protein product [Mytilus coruscus]|uniref:TIR domain-containing protein n=1 Tax=Mytilus coruscus TaxID=42192 RepID=A0A6J8DGF6_MYTCO|nr:unnamed protein product [Mytilus coruscus]
MKEKAKIIEDQIGEIVESRDPDDIKEKAICIVEQGYAVLFEEFADNELEAQQKLVDSFELIKAEQNISIGERKDLLCLASKYKVNARRLLCLAFNCKGADTVTNERSSVEMFQKGIQYLRDTSYSMENIYIWTYYYAMSYNRMPDISNVIGVQAVDLFWSIIVNLPQDNESISIYRARAYAYIGHKIITQNEAFNTYLSKSTLASDKKFLALLKAPLSAFKLAIAELPDDEVILNRKGISLWSMFKFGSARTENEKNEYLEQAEKTLSLSISQNPQQQVKIAEYLTTILTGKDFLTARRLRIRHFKPSTNYGLEYNLHAASLFQADIGSAGVPHNRYDYFIIMSGLNSGWIQCFLQNQLSIQMVDGWPGAIDYGYCSSLLETTIGGINECRKSILVLSKDFLKREWCVLKTIITKTLKRRSDFLRIIMLENCDIPPEIDSEHLSFFDFTDDKKIPIKIQHLKLALLEN